jgi:hypothetical protein
MSPRTPDLYLWPIVWHIATSEAPLLREGAQSLLAKNFPETHRQRKERLAAGQPDESI